MLLLSPIILVAVFGMLLASNPALDELQPFAPFMAFGAISLGLVSIAQLTQNQFGLDRDGFRFFVLSPIQRRRILIGKNLATAPMGVGIGLAVLVGLQFFVPLGLDRFCGALFQLCSAYLLCCLVGNLISILGPMRLKQNAWKADNPRSTSPM